MRTEQSTKTEFLKVSRFQSIRTRIILFALLATIIPSLILGWQSYRQNSKLLGEKISQELRNATVQASGKLDLWLKERLYDLRVFSSSYIISENLAVIKDGQHSKIGAMVALGHIKAYLKSIEKKFSIYEELILIDLAGKHLVTDADGTPPASLPAPWLNQLKIDPALRTKVNFAPYLDEKSMFIAETVRASDSRPLGILGAKIDLNGIRSILIEQTKGGIDETYLLDAESGVLVSSISSDLALNQIDRQAIKKIASLPHLPETPNDYISHHNKAVVGMAAPIESVDWILVAETDKNNAFADIVVLRRYTILLVGGLMFSIGLLAYLFGHRLVRPLQRLSKEAASVASGNLEVDIPVAGLSEVSYLTQVFNHMVDSLRHNRDELSTANNALLKSNEELHQLSITDGLTGLSNHKHIMNSFHQEMARSKRYNHKLAILMLDIDFFKNINDTYGHQVGDTVLRRLAGILSNCVRESDYTGRYGGEEFLIILPGSDIQSAFVTAERIRQHVGRLQFTEKHENFSVTVSIGVSGFPEDGQAADTLLGCADDALYQAKAGGRNRVVASNKKARQLAGKIHLLPGAKFKPNN